MTKHDCPSRVDATFKPKVTATLRPCTLSLIGKTFTFVCCGTSHDDEPYPGQTRWLIAEKHYGDLPDDVKGLWFPFEDLEVKHG